MKPHGIKVFRLHRFMHREKFIIFAFYCHAKGDGNHIDKTIFFEWQGVKLRVRI